MEAWIEIRLRFGLVILNRVPFLWRGGLKCPTACVKFVVYGVALLRRAWIEIVQLYPLGQVLQVALLARAGIEINLRQ